MTGDDDKMVMVSNVKSEWLLPHFVGLCLGQRRPVGPTGPKHG